MSNSNSRFFSEALIISILPVIAYAVTFYYERGYLGFFGIPEQFIKVSFESFFISLSCLVSFLMSIFLFVHGIMIMWPKENRKNIRLFMPLIATLFYFLLLLALQVEASTLKIAFSIIFVFTAIYYIPPFFSKKGTSYIEKLRASFATESKAIERGLYAKLEAAIGRPAMLMIFLLFLYLPLVMGSLGAKIAKNQKTFAVVEYEGKNYFLLRQYNDFFLSIEVNDKEKAPDKNFILIELSNLNSKIQTMKIK